MAKLGVNIVGGPESHSIKVTNAETGDELKGITGGTINLTLDGLTATFTVLVNHLDVKLDKLIVREEEIKGRKCGGCKTESLTQKPQGLWMSKEEYEKYKPAGEDWT